MNPVSIPDDAGEWSPPATRRSRPLRMAAGSFGSHMDPTYRPRIAAARLALAALDRPSDGHGKAVVEITGAIDSALAHRVEAALRAAPRADVLEIWIDSAGGSVTDAFSIYDQLRGHQATTKRAIVKGACHSASVIVLLAGDHRRCLPGATLLSHETEIRPATSGGRWTARRYSRAAAHLAALDERVVNLMASRTGAPRSALAAADADESGKPMPMSRALALGIVHQADGFPSRCTASWPAIASQLLNARVPLGLPAMLFSAAFLAACDAAPR